MKRNVKTYNQFIFESKKGKTHRWLEVSNRSEDSVMSKINYHMGKEELETMHISASDKKGLMDVIGKRAADHIRRWWMEEYKIGDNSGTYRRTELIAKKGTILTKEHIDIVYSQRESITCDGGGDGYISVFKKDWEIPKVSRRVRIDDTVKYRILKFIYKAGHQGVRYTDIVKFIVEDIKGKTYDHKKHRGMWASNLVGTWQQEGIFSLHCGKNDNNKYILTDAVLIDHFNDLKEAGTLDLAWTDRREKEVFKDGDEEFYKNLFPGIYDDFLKEGKFYDHGGSRIETDYKSSYNDNRQSYPNKDDSKRLLLLFYIYKAGEEGRRYSEIVREYFRLQAGPDGKKEESRWIEDGTDEDGYPNYKKIKVPTEYNATDHRGLGGTMLTGDDWHGKPTGLLKAHCVKNKYGRWVLVDKSLTDTFYWIGIDMDDDEATMLSDLGLLK